MSGSRIESEQVRWLLEPANPSIRYRTLVEVLGRYPDEADVSAAAAMIRTSRPAARILSRQSEEGLWPQGDYGSHSLLRYLSSLAELGLGRDDRLDAGIDQAVRFLAEKRKASGLDRYDGCSEALLLRAMVMLGYGAQPAVRDLLESYADTRLRDGGFICQRLLDERSDRKSCFRASVAALLLYAACAQHEITLNEHEPTRLYFLARDVFLTSDRSNHVVDARPGWRYVDNFFPPEPMRVGLPLIVHALAVLGDGSHPGVQAAWSILNEKPDEHGRLSLEGTLSKQPVSFGAVGKPNKWMTFYYEAARARLVSNTDLAG